MTDRTTVSLVVSNVALAIAVVALVLVLVAGRPLPPTEQGIDIAPPAVTMSAQACPSQQGCWTVTITTGSSEVALWRVSASLYMGDSRAVDPPATLIGSRNIYAAPWLGPNGAYLNFSDEDSDGQLSEGDRFDAEGLSFSNYFAVRLFWAATGHEIAHVIFGG